MMGLWRHLVVLGAAVAITVVGFGIWIALSHAVGNYLSREDEPQQMAEPTQQVQNPGEVTVKIINQPTPKVYPCSPAHPCPFDGAHPAPPTNPHE